MEDGQKILKSHLKKKKLLKKEKKTMAYASSRVEKIYYYETEVHLNE